jgi:outer membrane protein TolC
MKWAQRLSNKGLAELIGSQFGFVVCLLLASSLVASNAGQDRRLADSMAVEFQAKSETLPVIDSTSLLDNYLAYASIQSPALRKAFYQWKAALEKAGYAGALPDPMLSYAYFIENVETRVGPQNQKFSLKQSFPWFGTLSARKDIALEKAGALFKKYQSERLRLFYAVKAAYYDYYYLGRDIALTDENMELLKFWESVARAKYRVALKQHPDIIKAQVELGKLEDRLFTLRDKIGPTVARLRAILNLPDSVDLAIPRSITVDEIPLHGDSIMSSALNNNPDLQAMLHIIDKERAGVKLARKASLPNFTFGVDYIETGPAINPALSESGKDPWIVSVGVNLPIWFGKNKARKREADAKYRAAQYDYAEAQNRLTAFVEKLVFEYSDAMRKTQLYRDGLVPKAEQALNASYTAYQAGETDFLNVLDAQRQLLTFLLELEEAVTDLATHRAEIEMVIGEELEQ